jgi:hypothetical protein
MMLEPVLLITKTNPELLSGALSNITGARVGIWETDIGLSPVLIIFLFTVLAAAIANFRRNTHPNWKRSVPTGFILLVFAVWITIEMTFAKGIIYTSTKHLPILRSLHVNVRFAAAFMLPLIIIGTFELHQFFHQKQKQSYFPALVLLTIASLFSYFSLASDVHTREFNVSSSNVIHEKIRSGNRFPISDIADINPRVGFSENASSYRPYEPIFGYHLEEFTPEIHYGKILETSDGYFNMTNPASLVFPEINNTHPFDRIKVDERDKLEIFLQRGQPGWNIPTTQKILNVLSFVTFIFCVGALVMTLITTAIGKK